MELSVESWKNDVIEKQGVIVDVRTSIERESGYIESSVHCDYYDAFQFVETLKKWDKSRNYFVYCQSGARGQKACIVMKNHNFENVFNLSGGYNAYKKTL